MGAGAVDDRLRDLVDDLHRKLPSSDGIVFLPEPVSVKATTRHYTAGVPLWLTFVALTVLLVLLGFAVVQPWDEECPFRGELCKIAAVDLDDLQRQIPDSELLVVLPDLPLIDLQGDMTAGDLFAMERFSHVDFAALISPDDIQTLLDDT